MTRPDPTSPPAAHIADRSDSVWTAVLGFLRRRLARGDRYGLGLTLAVLAVGLALWGFIGIVDGITEQDDLYRIDNGIQQVFETVATPQMTRWTIWLTSIGGNLGATLISLGIAAVLALRRRGWTLLEWVLIAAGGGLLTWALKGFFGRARPDAKLIEITSYSFPSGHSLMAMAMYGWLITYAWRRLDSTWGRAAATVGGGLMIVLLGLSRLYLGVHWATDILGGYLAGFLWLAAVIGLVQLIERRQDHRRPEEDGSAIGKATPGR